MADLAGIIARHDADFSPNDRRIAEHVLAHLDDVAFASADDLAAAIGVSKAAVVRFGARLGLGGFGGLQDAAAAGVRKRLDPHESAADSLPARWHQAVIDDLERRWPRPGPRPSTAPPPSSIPARAGCTCSVSAPRRP